MDNLMRYSIPQNYGYLNMFGMNGNKYEEGGPTGDWDFLEALKNVGKKILYRNIAWDGKRFRTEKEKNEHQAELERAGLYHNGIKRTPNTSPTSKVSTNIENRLHDELYKYRKRNNFRTKPYDIPYGNRTIEVREKDAALARLSVNALDSIAKYAGITKTPIITALGLPRQETNMGRTPLYNLGRADNPYPKKEFANSNYIKAFGSIPAEYLVRDFVYNSDISGKNGKRDTPIPLSTPPLQHAFTLFNEGKYNTGDPHHTQDVKDAGKRLWNESTGNLKKWWEKEGRKIYYGKY